jgi:murein L,D-transpeptidase YafK
MRPFSTFIMVTASVVLAGLLLPSSGLAAPAVQKVVVYKSERVMLLLSGGEVVRSYRVALGGNPLGHKQRAGDCRTPEGTYFIDRRNGRSRFYKSLHISYPNGRDRAASRKKGTPPGGDIMIHGLPEGFDELSDVHYKLDWTKGCIAVNNAEMEEIWGLVPDGTMVRIEK